MSGKITEIAGRQIITRTKGDITMRVTNGSLELQAGEKTVLRGKDDGITFGMYNPEETPPHPQINRVVFLDEADRELNQDTDDFLYGQPLKIRVTTSASAGSPIGVVLKGEAIRPNQLFAFMDTDRYKWSGTVAEDKTFTTPPFRLLPLWYSDDLETYNYNSYKTEITVANLNAFFAAVTLGSQTAELPAVGARLKPRTYRRNYEEGIGLFRPGSTTDKDLSDNYETSFIRRYTQPGLHSLNIEDLVERLSNWLYRDHPEANTNAIEAMAAQIGSDLWNYAALQNQEHIITQHSLNLAEGREETNRTVVAAIADDRPLYWARNAMEVMLKRQYAFIADIKANHAAELEAFLQNSVVPPGSALWNALQVFEDESRNYSGTDFSRAASKKKVLLTGFDPFQLGPMVNGSNAPQTHNPSGALALALASMNLSNAYVQTCIFPVRYEDFDQQRVEQVMRRFMPEADVVITTSLNGGNPWFDVEENAIAYRGGFADNMYIGAPPLNSPPANAARFIANNSSLLHKTSLPKQKIFGSASKISINNINIFFDESFSTTEGAGSNYLSNEIMYRATGVRGNSSKPVGHIHLANLANDLGQVPLIISISKQIIERICS